MNRLLWILVFTFSVNVFSNALPPTLSNFRIEKDQPSRVYFDSSEEITASSTKGFIIGDKSISGIKIISGKTTGHYFTVSKVFNFWDNNLIRYEGGSNLQDKDNNKLVDFRLQYIQNKIPEPEGSGKTYYVSTSGNNSNNGLSEAKSWRTITYAANTAKAGDVVYIKAGDYGKENVIVKYSGSKDKPIKFIGYKNSINDILSPKRSVGMKFRSSEMPLIHDGKGRGIVIDSKSYIIVRNIQVDNYPQYAIQMDNSNYFILDNVYVQGGEFGIRTVNSDATNNRIINSYVANFHHVGIRLDNKNNLIDNVWAISSYKISMDYYINIYGGNSGENNTIRNCYVKRYENDSHVGHGISLKGGSPKYFLQNSLIENCEIEGTRGSIEFRHSKVQYNVARNVTITGNSEKSAGIKFLEGANHNIAERCKVSYGAYAILFKDGPEDPSTISGEYNKVFNCVFDNVEIGISGDGASGGYYNEISNNVFYKVNTLIKVDYPFGNTNKLVNNIIIEVNNRVSGRAKMDMTYNNFWNNGFSKPTGTGNISVNPKFVNISNKNFRLESTSKLIDAGKKIGYIKLDLAGSNRPQGSSHDIGPYEYQDYTNISINADAGNDVDICSGDNTTLRATGGTAYEWNTGATSQSITVSPSSTKTYTVRVFDGNTSATDDVLVSVNEVKASAGSNKTINEGEKVTLTASGGGTYEWSTGETTQKITVSPSKSTKYTVTVYRNGCEADDSVIVTVNTSSSNSVIADAGQDVGLCLGETTVLTASGGTNYEWSTGETSQSITVSPSSSKKYTVTVSDEFSSDSDDVYVEVNDLEAHAGADKEIDVGGSVWLKVYGGDTFLWSTGETAQSIKVSPTVDTRYTVTVYKNGCQAKDIVDVKINNPLPATIVADAGEDVEICRGESAVLTASGGSSYEWSTGETTQSISVTPTKSETYLVTVFEGNESAFDDVIVAVNWVNANAGADSTINKGDNTILTANGGNTYQWSTGETTQSIIVGPEETETYTVTAFKYGCSNTDKVTVTVLDVIISNPQPVEAFAGDDVEICRGESAVLTASGGSSYEWSTGETTQSISVTPTKSETYLVTVFEGNESAVDDVIVAVNWVNANAGADSTINKGDNTILTANGGNTYQWSTGETTQSIIVGPEETETYTVTAFKYGCSNTDKVTVTVLDVIISNPQPVEAFAGDDVSICLGESVTLNASGGDKYSWSTGDDQKDVEVNPNRTTTYILKATSNGIQTTDEVVVIVENCNISVELDDELENTFDIYPNPSEGILNLNISGSEKDMNLILVSTNGSVVYKDIISTKNTAVTKQVDLSRFAKGLYFVRLFNEDSNMVKKLLII